MHITGVLDVNQIYEKNFHTHPNVELQYMTYTHVLTFY